MTNPEFSDVVSLDGTADTKNKALPLIALPTTAGTAAEVTINYVITDEVRTKKMVCVDVHDIPVVAIIDPDLMQGMPTKDCSINWYGCSNTCNGGIYYKGRMANSRYVPY